MNKEMNKLLIHMVQYDLVSGLLISLIIGIISTSSNAGSYLAGISVALANFLIHGYTIERNLGKGIRNWLLLLGFFIRMAFIVITILPFRNNMVYMIFYMAGFISHYILLVGSNIIRREGSV